MTRSTRRRRPSGRRCSHDLAPGPGATLVQQPDQAGGFAIEATDITQHAPLDAAFYARDVLQVAPDLLGKLLCRRHLDGRVEARAITEVEAYRGEEDSACHARAGRTRRTAVMYRPGGVAYVYLCYGVHHLLNVVTGPPDRPQAALIRGLEGTTGPGRLTKALDVDLAFNGASLLGDGDLWLADAAPPAHISSGPRVGIGYATPEDQARPWRFWTS
ncbi:MAG: DNA-3-methyladenine glycosylase [Propionibacteriaceae bacterium]|jgi:DNA-3-methyladenine glycosylase|nr:DNA-3-methyladenine glycosylase [Propionibacteriaceae bacterium]